jgi:hypothetical protein
MRKKSQPRALVISNGARPTDRSSYVDRGGLSEYQSERPDIERRTCPTCRREVALRGDGSLKGHQASRGISCIGAIPR